MVNTTARRGAYCTAAALILLDLAYIVALATAGEPWTSPEAYGTAYKLTGMFPVFAGLTILIPYIVLLAAWHTLAQPQAKVWTLSALVFGGVFTAVTGTAYLIQILIVLPRIYSGNYLWLEALAFANDESIIWGLNYIGWLFLGVSKALLIGALGSSPRERLIKILLGVYFSASLLMVVGYALKNLLLQLPIIVCWFIIQPLIYILLGRYFSRLKS